MSVFDDFIDELRAVVRSAWPETDGNRMSGKASAGINWREAVSAAEEGTLGIELAFPLAVVESGKFVPTTEYGDGNDAWTTRLTCIYIFAWEDSEGGDTERLEPIEMEKILVDRFESMRTAMKADHVTFSVVSAVSKDDSIMCPTNQYLAKEHFPACALEVYVDVLIVVSDA